MLWPKGAGRSLEPIADRQLQPQVLAGIDGWDRTDGVTWARHTIAGTASCHGRSAAGADRRRRRGIEPALDGGGRDWLWHATENTHASGRGAWGVVAALAFRLLSLNPSFFPRSQQVRKKRRWYILKAASRPGGLGGCQAFGEERWQPRSICRRMWYGEDCSRRIVLSMHRCAQRPLSATSKSPWNYHRCGLRPHRAHRRAEILRATIPAAGSETSSRTARLGTIRDCRTGWSTIERTASLVIGANCLRFR